MDGYYNVFRTPPPKPNPLNLCVTNVMLLAHDNKFTWPDGFHLVQASIPREIVPRQASLHNNLPVVEVWRAPVPILVPTFPKIIKQANLEELEFRRLSHLFQRSDGSKCTSVRACMW